MGGHGIGDNDNGEGPTLEVKQPDGDRRSQLYPEAGERIVDKIMDTLKKHMPLSQVKMMSTEKQSQTPAGNSSNAVPNKGPQDPASDSMPFQRHDKGQSSALPLGQNQTQPSQQLLPTNTVNNSSSAGVHNLPASMPPVASLNPTLISSTTCQDSNLQNIADASENTVGTSMGQGMSSNIHANSQRQLSGRQHSQQAQPIMQTSSIMKPITMLSTPLASPQQNPQTIIQQSMQSVSLKHPQSVHRQQQRQPPQQRTTLQRQPIWATQQLTSQQPDHTTMQQNQSLGQQNGVPDVQTQQLQQRLLSQHNNLRQQQMLGTQSSNGMQANQLSIYKLPSKVPVPQQSQPGLQSQMRSQPTQLQTNSLQQDMQQRNQTSGSLLQQQNVIDQQNELLQQQIALPEASPTSLDFTS
ncbi:hypothetical protein RJ641_026028 [Dillenia turbinata]|uniref:Uncharacterized protein n=1 Tax=Dillenia turbinata TaxID=194707 RepID=A0AAN8ZP40_9MAGN